MFRGIPPGMAYQMERKWKNNWKLARFSGVVKGPALSDPGPRAF